MISDDPTITIDDKIRMIKNWTVRFRCDRLIDSVRISYSMDETREDSVEVFVSLETGINKTFRRILHRVFADVHRVEIRKLVSQMFQ